MTKPKSEDQGSASREWDAATYHQVSEPQFAWGRAVLDRFVRLPLPPEPVIMDAGCGTGRLTAELLARLPRCRVVALDASQNMIQRAQETLRAYADRVSFLAADLQIFADDAAVDAVFSTATFHWVKDHPRLFANLYRTLRPGGWLCAQSGGAENLAREHQRANQLTRTPPYAAYFADWEEAWEFPSDGVTRARLVAAGFTDVSTNLEAAPVTFPDAATYARFATTVFLRPYLSRLPDDGSLRGAFVGAMTAQAAADNVPFHLGYRRVNMTARRP